MANSDTLNARRLGSVSEVVLVRAWWVWGSLAGAASMVAACAQIIGANDYEAGTGSTGSSGCVGDKGCYACAPMTRDQFLNACTGAQCDPFDPSRVTGLVNGARPDLPPDTGTGGMGSTSSSSASTSTSSTSSSTSTSSASSGTGGGPGNPLCSSLPNPVYLTGSSASKPFLSVVAQSLASQGKMTVIYHGLGSCLGVDAVLNATPQTGTASYWDGAQPNPQLAERTCDLDPAGNVTDIGISDVFATSCFTLPQGLPNGVSDTFGPVQAMELVTASGSTEKSISADAAYFVYGFGNASGIPPWTDESFIFQRSATSGTQNVVAATIGVPSNKFKGVTNATSDALLSALLAAGQGADAAKTIGILSSDYADLNRSKLRVLAFQDVGQTCGYYPDSTPTALDKKNVRDGHYPMWGPLHFLTRNASQNALSLVNYLSGVQDLPNLNLVQVYVDARVVPLCAMKVTRDADGAPLKPYAPPKPCGCAFEAQATGTTSCKACTAASQCPTEAPNCSFGYCEP